MKIRYSYFLFISFLVLCSCSITKYVPENRYLLNSITVKSDVKEITKEQVKPFFRQIPNPGIFGAYKLQLAVYNISGKDTSKWLNRMWRKMGEPPVIYDEFQTELTRKEILKYLQNKGYINAHVNVDVQSQRKKADITYHFITGKPYTIRTLIYNIEDSTILSIITKDTANALIKRGDLFDIDVLDLERQRLSTLLKAEGYYYFNKEYLHYVADSSFASHEVDVNMELRPMLQTNPDGTVDKVLHKRMKIGRVSLMPWYDATKGIREQRKDTIRKGAYYVYYPDSIHLLHPDILIDNNYILPGSYYNEKFVEKTYGRINSLPVVKYVNINFRERTRDSMDCLILITPTKIKTVTLELEGTNSDGDLGAAVNIGYQHRNIFRNSELLSLKLRGAYEALGQISNSIEVGGDAAILFPQFLFPFLSQDFRKQVRASTELSLTYSYQTRLEYSRTVAGGAFKYVWGKDNARYGFDLFDLSYVYLPYISQEFRDKYINNSSILRYSYEDHFIMRSGFSFANNNKPKNSSLASFTTYRGNIETAGNLLYAISSLAQLPLQEGVYKIGNIRFAQYVKGDFDIAYNRVMDKNNRFIYHAALGVACPYGNAEVLPFEKRYFSGGANSVRGWSVRTLGPGIYKSTSGYIDFMNQSGDIKLDFNFEYRFKLFWVLEGAAFLDAGNVWTIKDYDTQPGGQFKFDSFYKQLACSYGLGLRFDFKYFLVRIDMGVKLYDPSQNRPLQWRVPSSFPDDYALHFAVGYPF